MMMQPSRTVCKDVSVARSSTLPETELPDTVTPVVNDAMVDTEAIATEEPIPSEVCLGT